MIRTHAVKAAAHPVANERDASDLAYRILVVDDDDFLRTSLASALGHEGFQTRAVSNGEDMFHAIARFDPDLVLLDVRLPGEDGFSLLRRMREQGDTPVVLLTAKDDTLDKVLGLELGADDYVTKPFQARELVARIRARLRNRSFGSQTRKGRVSFAGWELDLDGHSLRAPDGDLVELTSHEYRLLNALVAHAGRVLDRDQILDLIAGREWTPSDRSVDVLVAKLRRKLGDDPKQPRLIRTIHGAGYMFVVRGERG